MEMTITSKSVLLPPLSRTNPKDMSGFSGSSWGLKMSKGGDGLLWREGFNLVWGDNLQA